jgi:hypothetical protein
MAKDFDGINQSEGGGDVDQQRPPIYSSRWYVKFIHDDVNLCRFVIPGLTRNPVFSWIPAFAGMTSSVVINDAVYRTEEIFYFSSLKMRMVFS